MAFPLSIQIQTNTKCNAACKFCPYPYTEGKKEFQLMDWDLYTKIIDECSKHRVREILPFFLAEPLLNKDLAKYIQYAKEKCPDAVTKIFTNGSVLDEKKAQELLDVGIDEVIFSFNGITKDIYEFTMKNLNYEKTKQNIENFIKLRGEKIMPRIAIHMLKLNETQDQLEEATNYWNSLGVAVHSYKYENRAGNVENYDIIPPPGIRKTICSRLRTQIYILADGRVVLCCADWKNEVILGDIKTQTIEEIWNDGPRLHYFNKHIEQKFDELKLCNNCNFNEFRA